MSVTSRLGPVKAVLQRRLQEKIQKIRKIVHRWGSSPACWPEQPAQTFDRLNEEADALQLQLADKR